MEAMFLCGGVWVEMEVPRVCGGWREWGNHPRVNKKLFPAILFPILCSKIGVISLGGSALEEI